MLFRLLLLCKQHFAAVAGCRAKVCRNFATSRNIGLCSACDNAVAGIRQRFMTIDQTPAHCLLPITKLLWHLREISAPLAK